VWRSESIAVHNIDCSDLTCDFIIIIINIISRLVLGIGFLAARQGRIAFAAAALTNANTAAFGIPRAHSSFRQFQSLRLAQYATGTFETPITETATTSTGKRSSQSSTSITNTALSSNMPRGVKKENLPTKVCLVCNRPFNWRKKWESCWEEVTTCSKSCNFKRKAGNQETNRAKQRGGDDDNDDESDSDGDGDKGNHRNTKKGSVKHKQRAVLSATASSTMPDVTEDLSRLTMVADADEKGDTSDDELIRLLAEHVVSLNDGDNNGEDDDNDEGAIDDDSASEEELDPRAARKAAKKRTKAARRAVREGRADPGHGQKDCDVCSKSVDLLIRCTIDSTGAWNMVCGKCWKDVSGGVVDGDASHPHYRYGGLWKNRVKR
jgi:hypothetical protein